MKRIILILAVFLISTLTIFGTNSTRTRKSTKAHEQITHQKTYRHFIDLNDDGICDEIPNFTSEDNQMYRYKIFYGNRLRHQIYNNDSLNQNDSLQYRYRREIANHYRQTHYWGENGKGIGGKLQTNTARVGRFFSKWSSNNKRK